MILIVPWKGIFINNKITSKLLTAQPCLSNVLSILRITLDTSKESLTLRLFCFKVFRIFISYLNISSPIS